MESNSNPLFKNLKIRKLSKRDAKQYNELFRYAFQVTISELNSLGWKEDEIQRTKSPIIENANVIGWFDERKLVSQICVYPMEMNIHNEIYKIGGVTGVATYPEYSGLGLMHSLMKKSLENMRKAGQYFSVLCPYSIPFYRKKGWEIISDTMEYQIKDTQLPKKHNVDGMVERVPDNSEDIKIVHDKFFLQRHGVLKRNELEWNEYWKWESDDVITAVYYNRKDEPTGYIVYYLENEIFKIKELVYLNIEAYYGIWNYITNHFSMITEVKGYNYTNDPISFFLEDGDIQETIKPNVMGRIVDFEQFIKKYPFKSISIHNNLHFQVTDPMLECNNGDFEVFWDKDGEIHVDKKIGGGYNEDTDGELVKTDIQTLSALFMSYKTATYLKNTERLIASKKAVRILEEIIPSEQPYFSDYF